MERFAILRPHLEGGTLLPEGAVAAGIPLLTAVRWLARYRADGITGLARRNPTGHREGQVPRSARHLRRYSLGPALGGAGGHSHAHYCTEAAPDKMGAPTFPSYSTRP
jgi:hypothetical protein